MDLLPNEILSHILYLIVHDPEQHPTFAFSVSQVCARWRDLSISTPKLWTRIAFTFPITESQHISADYSLQRSESQPLTILMDCRDPNWDWEEEGHAFQWSGMQDTISQLLPHASRWKSLDILTDTWLPIYSFLRLTKTIDPLLHLESLSLSRCNAYFAARGQSFQPLSMAEPIALFGGMLAPKLREVCLVGVHIDWERSAALSNLTSLDFKYHAQDVLPTLSQFASILDRCPGLQQLTILGWGPRLDDVQSQPVTSLVLPSLTRLSFGFVDMAYGTQFLSMLQIPGLKELSLEDVSTTVNPIDTQESSQILEWLFTSQPAARASFSSNDGLPVNPIPLQSVTSLELHHIRSTQSIFASLFRCFPNLSALSCIDVSDEALLALCPYAISDPTVMLNKRTSSRTGCLCPVLEDLYCQDADPEVLVALVTERSIIGSVPPLQSVTLEYARSSRPSDDSEELSRLENTGIQVIGSPGGSEGSESE